MHTPRRLLPGLAVTLALSSCAPERAEERPPREEPIVPTVTATPVTRGAYGMAAQLRWTMAPDRGGILVVIDASSVEAEAYPDGFFFGLEDPPFAVQVDSVWDVVPSPDWRTVAYSRAFLLSAGEADSVPTAMWQDLARRTGIDARTLRTSAFDASAMAYMKGIAQPAVIRVPADPRAPDAAQISTPRPFAIARGWQIRWTADGSLIALGSNPEMVQDDAPSGSWSALDPRTGAVSVALPAGARMVEPRWVQGPVLTFGVPVNVTEAPPITVQRNGLNYMIESQRGVITIRDPAFRTGAAIAVGPGVALAATASGRYIVAVRPRTDAPEYETPLEAVVYTATF